MQRFIRIGVISGMRQLLEFGLFHGDPHPGNIFALHDGRIAYVDFGNVAELRCVTGLEMKDAGPRFSHTWPIFRSCRLMAGVHVPKTSAVDYHFPEARPTTPTPVLPFSDSQRNKEVLIDAVVHAVNQDYSGMAEDFIKLGFLAESECWTWELRACCGPLPTIG